MLDISFESLNFENSNDSSSNNISLEDLYETISLYDYEDQAASARRITWEQWYLNKKIESLKNEKCLEEKMRKVCYLDFHQLKQK